MGFSPKRTCEKYEISSATVEVWPLTPNLPELIPIESGGNYEPFNGVTTVTVTLSPRDGALSYHGLLSSLPSLLATMDRMTYGR